MIKEFREKLYEKEKKLKNEEELERRQYAKELKKIKNFLERLRE